MNQPYVFGQSGTDRPEPVLVTRPPAKISAPVEAATSAAKRGSIKITAGLTRPALRISMPAGRKAPTYAALYVNATAFDSFAPTVTVIVWVPSFSCHASIVYVPGGSPLIVNVPSAAVTA